MLTSLGQDLVFTTRLLSRQRLPTLVAVVCLALGIGATTTMFSVGSTLLLDPLPFPRAERLVQVFSLNNTSVPDPPSSYLDLLDWRRRAHVFEAMGGVGQWDYVVRLGGEPHRVSGGLATAGFFETLGAVPEAGRLFMPEEDRPGGPRVAIVSHGLAERVLGSATGAVGRVVDVTGEPTTIVGVMPDRWRFPSRAEIWVPVAHANGRDRRGSRNLQVVAALKPGMTVDDARRDLAAVGAQLAAEYPETNAGIRPVVLPLRERYIGPARLPMEILTVASLLVLLVACANAAGLQLAHAAQRTREIAMRAALGAGRARIGRQALTESVLLALVAAALGTGLAVWGTAVVSRAVAAGSPAWLRFGLDGRALAFAVAVSVLVGIGFGVVPALRLAAVDPAAALHGGDRSVGVGRSLLQRTFVAAEVALSLMLLVGAGLALLGVYRLGHVRLGFDADRVLVFRTLLEGPQYDVASRRVVNTEELLRRLKEIPGVEAVAAVGLAPVLECCSRYGISVEGHPNEPGKEPLIVGNVVTPGYFATLRIPIIGGRDFAAGEGSDTAPVAIVNEAFARAFWADGEAVGHRLRVQNDAWARVVGVVGDARQNSLGEVPEPQVYFPYAQERWSGMYYVVRSRVRDAGSLLPSIRRTVFQLDPGVPVYAERTMTQGIAEQLVSPRTVGSLIAGFAVVALLLATAGVYAIMAFYVSQRRRELGVRIALGAAPTSVLGMVLWQGTGLAVVGALVGLLGSWLASKALASAFYGVSAFEPLLYAGPAVLLVGTAALASYVPALRASRVDPMEALRGE